MRILHTADWHMNDTLGRVDRSADIVRSLEQITRYLAEQRVDVMLVAGDVFSDRSRPDQLRLAVSEIRRLFLPFLERGGTMVVVSGNHDNEIFFKTLRDALDLVAPGRLGLNNTDATGRLYLAPDPRLLRLTDTEGNAVQFVLMPYPTARNYLRGENTHYRTVEERHRALQQKFVQVLNEISSRLDVRAPSVLVSHIHVRGAQVHSLYRLSEVEDVIFEPNDIPAHWTYVAYGHVHRPQLALSGAPHIRYAGSVERMSASESADNKSVVLFEIRNGALVGEPTLLPLESTPIYSIEISDPARIPLLGAQYADAEHALVHYTLHWDPKHHNRDALCDEIGTIFPRWYERELKEIGVDEARGESFTPERMRDVIGTVRDYLGQQLAKHPQREELMGLAETLLAEEVEP